MIKRKQQVLSNVKKCCGVSYVKKSESKQLNVRDRGYEKLPPIVIQGSYTIPSQGLLSKDEEDESKLKVDLAIKEVFLSQTADTYLVVTAFESPNEVEMKNYLLKPHKRMRIANGNFWLVKHTEGDEGKSLRPLLESLWMFVKDKYFLCVHFCYSADKLISSFKPRESYSKKKDLEAHVAEFIVKSDVCLGFLPKKGNASIKSMLKVYKIEELYSQINSFYQNQISEGVGSKHANISGVNTIAYLSRLELYVPEDRWKESTLAQKF